VTKTKKEKEETKDTKQRLKRNMEQLGPVLESFMDDLEEYQCILSNQMMEAQTFKERVFLQQNVIKKMEEALNAFSEASALTHVSDGGSEDGARKKKKSSD